jgi:hypothetical protein
MTSADYAQVMGDGLTRISRHSSAAAAAIGVQHHLLTAPSVAAHSRRQAESTVRANDRCSIAPATHAQKNDADIVSAFLIHNKKQLEGTSKHTTINQINERKAPLPWD